MNVETLKKDLIGMEQKYVNLVNDRNGLNLEIFRMEGAVTYVKALIDAEEREILAIEKTKEVKKEEG